MGNSSIKISVVIPVFNGEKYLSKTLESIIRQSFSEFEIVCVDDCSRDGSLSILKRYEERDSRVRVFTTKTNLGIVPKVVNYILPELRGEYFFYSSQDDLFSDDLLENLFKMAVETGANAVIPDLLFYHEDEVNESRKLIGVHGNREVVLTGREAVELSLDWTIPGNALLNIDIVRNIRFFDFSMNADEYSVRVFFLNCNKVVFSEGTFFYRRDNPEAVTKKLSSKLFDMPYTDFMLWAFLKNNNFQTKLQARVIERAVSGLIKMKALLILHNVKNFYKDASLLGAEERIRKCFSCLKEETVSDFINNRDLFKKRFAAFSVNGSYRKFSLICHLRFFHNYLKNSFK